MDGWMDGYDQAAYECVWNHLDVMGRGAGLGVMRASRQLQSTISKLINDVL